MAVKQILLMVCKVITLFLDLFDNSKNRIWYGCHTGLSIYDGQKYKNFDKEDGLPSKSVSKIFEDSKGQIWALSNTPVWNDDGGFLKSI